MRNNYFELVTWFVTFLICLACPPLFVFWVGALVLKFLRIPIQRQYRKAEQIRTRDIPPRGYRSGEALRRNRRNP